MPATFEPIASTTLSSSASSITFSGISSSAYTNLYLVLVGSANAPEKAVMRFNNSSAPVYNWTFVGMENSGYQRGRADSQEYVDITPASFFDTTVKMIKVYIPQYNNTSFFKNCLSELTGDKNGTGETGRNVGVWRNTSAINSVQVAIRYGALETFSAGTTATLYGIKGA